MNEKKDYAWAIFLIFLGTMLLLNTTGVLEWSIWLTVLRFWPILLILGGLKLILGENKISNIITSSVLIIFLLIIAFCLLITEREFEEGMFENCKTFCTNSVLSQGALQEERFNVKRDKYEDIERIDYSINLGVSRFEITDGAEEYMELDAKFSEIYGRPTIEVKENEELLNVVINENTSSLTVMGLRAPKYNFRLPSDILSNIKISNGVGSGKVLLENMLIDDLEITTGTGDVEIDLRFNAIPTERIKLDIGTGNITLLLPSDVGYIVDYSVGVGNISMDELDIDGLGRKGTDVKSSNYDEAEKVVNIEASVGVGNLEIKFNN